MKGGHSNNTMYMGEGSSMRRRGGTCEGGRGYI